MEMSYNITADMTSFASMQLEDLGIDVEKDRNKDQHNAAHPRPPASSNVPKKKRRISAKASRAGSKKGPTVQNLAPPLLTGYGDTIFVTNPFDDSPPKTTQCMMMNVGASLGQRTYPYRMEALPTMRGTIPMMRDTTSMIRCTSPMMRVTSPMMPMINVMGPPMMSNNTGNMRPMLNHVNNMSGCAIVNQAAPTSFTSPMSIVRQRLSSVPMNAKNHVKIGDMINHQMTHIGNSTNETSSKNFSNEKSMSMNNANSWVRQNRPLNVQLHVNNANNSNDQKVLLLDPCNMGNDACNFERIDKTNIKVSQQNEMALSSDSSMSTATSNKSESPSMGHPTSQTGTVQHPNLQRALNIGPKPRSSEKIYPADQPVIFNCQNPNAPPIYPCGLCHKEVSENDQGIICESGCNFWFHRVCLGLSEAAFQFLTQEIYAEWACDNCLSSKIIPVVKFKP